MRAMVEAIERGRDRGEPRCECKSLLAAFEIGGATLERHAGRVLGAGIVVTLVDARTLLHEGRGRIDRHHYRTGRGIGLLSGVHTAGGEVEIFSLAHSVSK